MMRSQAARLLSRSGRLHRAQSTATTAQPTNTKLFDKILIANRGEISCRVSRTAHKMGIKTVAVYSDPDAHAVHVRAADEAVCIGPAQSRLSYLNIPRILEAVRQTGAQAVHPGYGFLSENSKFVAELEKMGTTFIGPPSGPMDALGDKIHSKTLAIKAGVNTIPGYLGDVPNAEEAVKIARQIGYPVMVKASSGGGGKGMRCCYSDDEVRLGYRLSKEEAKSSFASDVIFIEKFIEEPRHIEIQLIADKFGNVVPLPERECTIQRRNQKVIEESPSVLLDPATRKRMQQQAASLASAVGYYSAGTCEFLCDKHKNFYFLEMNTRLQVEHPVTEAICGLDLVELMIRVAAGERLPSSIVGVDIPIIGHAFEARVYAEDPFRGFLPSTGRLSGYQEPIAFADRDPFLSEEIRCDAGVTQGSEISMFYDPMICKLITHGKDRATALDRLRAALDVYVVRGVGHNVSFLRDLTENPRFVAGQLDTGFIPREYPGGFKGVKLTTEQYTELVTSAAIMNMKRQIAAAQVEPRSPLAKLPFPDHVIVTLGARVEKEDGTVAEPETFEVKLELEETLNTKDEAILQAESYVPKGGMILYNAKVTPLGPGGTPGKASGASTTLRLIAVDWAVDSPVFLAALVDTPANAERSRHVLRVQQVAKTPDGFALQFAGTVQELTVRTPEAYNLSRHLLPQRHRDLSRVLVSPMPGTLVSLAVTPGQTVEQGQEVCVVEAMKMQNVLRSPKHGTVKKILGKVGGTLAVDEVIMEFD